MTTLEQQIRKQNEGREEILDMKNGSWNFIVEKFNFEKYNASIIVVQWTKTQKAYAIRFENYFTGKRHFLSLPADTLNHAKKMMKQGAETGTIEHWTGYVIETGKLLS